MPGANVFKFNSVKFPKELGTDEVPNYIRFEPVVVEYGGTSQEYGNTLNIPTPNTAGTSNIASGNNGLVDFSSIIGNLLGTNPSLSSGANLNFQFATNIGAFNISAGVALNGFGGINRIINGRTSIGAAQLSQGCTVKPNKLFTQGSINLYLPTGLSTNSSVDYSTTEMGQVGMEAINMVKDVGSKADALFSPGADGTEVSNIQKLFPAMLQQAVQLDDRLRAGIAISRGVVSNNYSYQIFNGVNHRTFSYSFKLIPREDKDSITIKYITDLFLFYMLPSKSNSNFHLYNIPCQWNISYMRKGNKLEFHQQPYPCFLQSVNISYGEDAGNATHNDGAPLDVNLSLEFVEIEPMYRRGE